MPRKRKDKFLAPKEREQCFIQAHIKTGADPAKIAACEKRAGMVPGDGLELLKRRSVQKQIDQALAGIRAEQMRQAVVSEAAQEAKIQFKQEVVATVEKAKLMGLNRELLIDQLMQCAIGINMHLFPKEKLDYIKAGLVLEGIIESGQTKRVAPLESGLKESSGGIYTNHFDRLAQGSTGVESSPESSASPPQDDAYELIPPEQKVKLPPPGEPIHENRPTEPSRGRVITVEVG